MTLWEETGKSPEFHMRSAGARIAGMSGLDLLPFRVTPCDVHGAIHRWRSCKVSQNRLRGCRRM